MVIRAIVPNLNKQYYLTQQEGPVFRSPKALGNELDEQDKQVLMRSVQMLRKFKEDRSDLQLVGTKTGKHNNETLIVTETAQPTLMTEPMPEKEETIVPAHSASKTE